RARDEGVDGTGYAAPRRSAVRARRGCLRGLDRRDVPRRRRAPLRRLGADTDHGAARRADAGGVGRPLGARGRVRRCARRARDSRRLPAGRVSVNAARLAIWDFDGTLAHRRGETGWSILLAETLDAEEPGHGRSAET